MTRIYETGRFPILNAILHLITSILFGFFTAWIALICWRNSALYTNTAIIDLAISTIIATIAAVLGGICFYWLSEIATDHLAGRELLGDTSHANSVYATSYTIATAYVIPYAYNSYDRAGDPYCDFYLSYSYDAVLSIHNYLRKKHRIVYRLSTLSLPSHLGRRAPLLSRHATEQILREMRAASPDHDTLIRQRVILNYPFYPSYSSNITLPEHQVFLSRSHIYELLQLHTPANGAIPPDSQIIVGIGPNESISLTPSYLKECLTRISTDNEFIYIPLA